jgi:tetratricopeptide (TPR) repeat protein
MEIAIFGSGAIWAARSVIGHGASASSPLQTRDARRLLFPITGMAVLLTMQMMPMPPKVLSLLSPTAYRVYQIGLPGWPRDSQQMSASLLLFPETAGRMTGSASASLARTWDHRSMAGHASLRTTLLSSIYPLERTWRPLTLAPAATSAGLLEFLALATVFLMVLAYPSRDGQQASEMKFERRMIYLIVGTGALVALLGIAEHASWNGKILWFYQPADWNGPLLVESPRASGPFVNPDHFANYLALSLPLAAAVALFPLCIIPAQRSTNIRVFFGCAVALMLIAATLSLSRGGGLAICVGVTLALAISLRRAAAFGPAIFRRFRLGTLPLSIATFALLAAMALYLIGEPGRSAVSTRLISTSASDFSARVSAWHQTLRMVAEFPLFGVGAGGWPEIFPHYQPPPQSRYFFFRTAENDYLQFVAESGLAGVIILVVFVALMIRAVAPAARRIPAQRWPLFAGLIGGLSAALVQELVDSSLRIPANALLFTILLALLLRVGLAEPAKSGMPAPMISPRSRFRMLLVPAAMFLMIAALRQDGQAYPYMLDRPENAIAAAHNLVEHPAMAAAHLAVAQMLPDASEPQQSQLSAAVWLEPNKPLARDLFARNLLFADREAEALAQLSISVYRAPFVELHYYLAPPAIAWLLPEEQEAIARGFERAIDADFAGAADALASSYMALGRMRNAAEAYKHAAKVTLDNSQRLEFLLKAGTLYGQLHDYANGGRALLEACSANPGDPRPYVALAENIYGPEQKLVAASAIIDQGLRAGADPYRLEMALAAAGELTGDHRIAEAALARALDYAPNFDVLLRLGRVYFAEDRFVRATGAFQRAVELNPQSAEAFMWLGRSHEASYDYYRAGQAYRQAISLSPADKTLLDLYQQLQRRTAAQEPPGSPD